MCENVVYKSFVATDQGRRDYMEDFVCISRQQQMNENKRNDNNFTVKCRENSIEYFAVFDGHGGSDAASFAQNYLLSEISKQTGFWSQDRRSVSNSITEGFISTTKAMWRVYETWPRTKGGRVSTAGTTASIAIIRDETLYVANVGDSSVVIGELAANGCCVAKTLTVDHKPELEQEKQRIEKDGGGVMDKGGIVRVVWKRPITDRRAPVCRSTDTKKIPFLAVSRALGDLWSYNAEKDAYVVSPKPDVIVLDINKSHCFLILATDGLWHVVQPAQAVDVVARLASYMMSSGEEDICPATVLVRLALQKWTELSIRADNISVIVVLFENCRTLGSSAFKYDCISEDDGLAVGLHSTFSTSDTPIRNPVDVGPVKRKLYKAHCGKKSRLRKPLTLISDTLNNKSDSVKRHKHRFRIPTTPEQQAAYWSRRKSSKMIENLPLPLTFAAAT